MHNFLLWFLLPLKHEGQIFTLAERLQIFDTAFDTLGCLPLPGEPR